MPLGVTSTNVSGAVAINMAMAAGETVAQPVQFSPLDLTGCEVKMQVEFPTPLVLSIGNGGITLTDPAQGQLQINIASATSDGFAAGAYPYEFWVVGPTGAASRLWTGTFTVNSSFTPIP